MLVEVGRRPARMARPSADFNKYAGRDSTPRPSD